MPRDMHETSEPRARDRAEVCERIRVAFSEAVPHNAALGMKILRVEPRRARAELPYREDLIGDPTTGVIHGGAITSLIDATCGCAVLSSLREVTRVATLDLRIDYLKAAQPGRSVFCDAECYRLTPHVAFVRATAHHDAGRHDAGRHHAGQHDAEHHDGEPCDATDSTARDSIATSAGTFMIFAPRGNAP